MTDIDKVVGGNIKRFRKQHAFTQGDVAEYLGLDQTMVSKIESGERSIGVAALEKLGDLFFCALDDFLCEPGQAVPCREIAFRANGLSGKDMEGLAAIGRIVRNLEEMTLLEKTVYDR